MKSLAPATIVIAALLSLETALANDTCATATDAGSSGTFTDSGTTATAFDDYDPNDCSTSGFPGGNDVVYRVSPPVDSMVHIEYLNLNDGVLYAATDCNDIENTCLGADDAKGTEMLDLAVDGGTDAFVICDSFFPGGGNYTISITIVPSPVTVAHIIDFWSWTQIKNTYR